MHLFLAIPGWRLSPFHAQSREQLVLECVRLGVDLTIHPDMTSGLERARNISIAKALETECTHVMFVDSDIAFDPADIFDMMGTGFDLIGAAYPKKGIDWESVIGAVKAGVPAEQLAEHCGKFVYNPANGGGPAGGFTCSDTGKRYVEVAEIGTGFMLMRREMLEKFVAYWKDEIAYLTDYEPRGVVQHNLFDHERDPECPLEKSLRALRFAALHYKSEANLGRAVTDGAELRLCEAASEYAEAVASGEKALGRYLTEDYAFCRRWTMMGGKVMMAADVRLMHQGTFVFQGFLGHQLGDGKRRQEAAE